jgi:hypothetical protein
MDLQGRSFGAVNENGNRACEHGVVFGLRKGDCIEGVVSESMRRSWYP